MNFHYTYTFQDYEAVNTARRINRRFAKLRDLMIWLLIGVNIAIGLVFLWWYYTGKIGASWLNFANLAIGAVILVSIYGIGPWYRHWYLRQQMVEGKIIQLEINEDGIIADLENTRTKTAWAGMHRVDELPTHFVVWINKIQAYSLPKRAISNKQDEKEIRDLLMKKIKNQNLAK